MEHDTLSVLIADDDDGDRKQVKRTLNDTRIQCVTHEVTSMDEALEATEHTRFDCAIVDYNMPGIDTLEGVQTLHERFPYMAIIMATGQGDELIASEAFKAGVSDYIPKSAITPEAIEHRLLISLEKAGLRKQIDEQREALQSYAHILAHDLQAPARQIKGFVELMEHNIKEQNYNDISVHIAYIKKSADNMFQMIETLSQYNKISGGKVAFTSVPMNDVATHVLNNLDMVIRRKNAQVTCDPNLPEIRGNKPQLIQLLQNLVDNGIKYCEAAVPTIHIGATKRNDVWEFSVRDSGVGIPKEYQEKIFEMFQRLHAQNDEFSGSGIGLAICRKIVQRHQGKIWCSSEKGEGTTFFFTIPAKTGWKI